MKFLRFIFDIFDIFRKAARIREDSDRRAKSVQFAVSSIIYSLIAVAAVLGGSFLMSFKEESGILIVFVIIIAVALFLGALLTFIGALLRVIAQFTLNYKPMSWVALVVLLLAIAASVIIIIHFI